MSNNHRSQPTPTANAPTPSALSTVALAAASVAGGSRFGGSAASAAAVARGLICFDHFDLHLIGADSPKIVPRILTAGTFKSQKVQIGGETLHACRLQAYLQKSGRRLAGHFLLLNYTYLFSIKDGFTVFI